MSPIVVFHGRLPAVTVERGELTWENCDGDGQQVFATIVAIPSCREAHVQLTTAECLIDGAAAYINRCDLAEGERYLSTLHGLIDSLMDKLEGPWAIALDQLSTGPICPSSCFTSLMGLLTEAFDIREKGDAFLFGSLAQWSFALSEVLPKVLPWDGSAKLSPSLIAALVEELDAHLRSAYPKIPGIWPA
jgi:hypothetical protein